MAFSKACLKYLILIVACAGVLWAAGPLSAQDAKIDFAKDIKPILEANCMKCHNEDDDEGGFRMDDRLSFLDEWVDPGAGEESAIVTDHLKTEYEDDIMPPVDEGGPLDDSDIALIVKWIDEGAVWPEDVELFVLSEEPVSDDANAKETTGDETAAGEGKDEKKIPKPYDAKPFDALGSLHPAAVHLPLGLLLAAGLFALLGLRGNFVMSDCAYYCLWLGTITAIFACVSGWWFSPMEKVGTVANFQDLTNMEQKVFWHRTSALVITACSFLLALFAAGARNRDPDDGFLWKLGLILLAGGIGWVGHEGGKLSYGKNHYKDVIGVFEAMTGWDADGNGVVDQLEKEEESADEEGDDAKADESKPDDENEEDSKVGETSDESGNA